jgi:hypothetical protein
VVDEVEPVVGVAPDVDAGEGLSDLPAFGVGLDPVLALRCELASLEGWGRVIGP